MRSPDPLTNLLLKALHGALVACGAVGATLAAFLVLPALQAITDAPKGDYVVRDADSAVLPPPPPPPEEVEPPEPEPEEEPPELEEQVQPLDLSQLELALNPGTGGADGWFAADLGVDLAALTGGKDVDALFSVADLDQTPRVVYQPGPLFDAKVRRAAPGNVYIIFEVDRSGRVVNPQVQASTDPIFERPALAAVKQWKFEPGKRKGEAVRFRMRVPITFPESE